MQNTEYRRFAQYYIEITDTLKNLQGVADKMDSEGESIPDDLASEIFRHTFIIDILTQAGKELYSKSPKMIYQDGWHFWFKENTELKRGEF